MEQQQQHFYPHSIPELQPHQSTTLPPNPSTPSQSSQPPSPTFSSPIGLRHNFLQSQLQHNLPPLSDPNSFHYGMTVYGFHPHLNARDNPLATTAQRPSEAVTWIDARHKMTSKGKEREQRRTQKITEMIEKLRLSRVKGGWKVEMKSKYHTLSTCAEYVKHLIKLTTEKEAAINKAKSDLQSHERKLEEQALSENRSDPESVTSSLTSSSSQASTSNAGASSGTGGTVTTGGNNHKRSAVVLGSQLNGNDSSSPQNPLNPSSSVSFIGIENQHKNKKVKICAATPDDGYNSSSTETNTNTNDEEGYLSMSDMTNSQRGGYASTTSSQQCSHANCKVKTKGMAKGRECRAIKLVDDTYKLDYKDVFLTSCVPQLISTPQGQIVTWNKFFLKVTRLTEHRSHRLTIFSIVKSDKLSQLFEIVATALQLASAATITPPATEDTHNDEDDNVMNRQWRRRRQGGQSWDFVLQKLYYKTKTSYWYKNIFTL